MTPPAGGARAEGPAVVLMTAARNEERAIGACVRSVLAQTRPPRAWVIVSDGSTDGTDEIVRRAAEAAPFVRLVRRDSADRRGTASKVMALRVALSELAADAASADYIGNLDADTELPPDHLERIVAELERAPGLGIAGGWVLERNRRGRLAPRPMNAVHSAPGCTQMFRRACFEEIGGYRPLPRGGEDYVAEVMARMSGWSVRSFPGLPVIHHPRPERLRRVRASWLQGREDWSVGVGPLYETLKSLRRLRDRPWLVAGLAHWGGYAAAALGRGSRTAPDGVADYLRREGRERIRAGLRGLRPRRRARAAAGAGGEERR